MQGEPSSLLDELVAHSSLPANEQMSEQKRLQVEQFLAALTPREQQVIRLLYSLNEIVACVPTYSGVARHLGCKDVSSLRDRAMSKRRALVALPKEQQQRVLEQKRRKYALGLRRY